MKQKLINEALEHADAIEHYRAGASFLLAARQDQEDNVYEHGLKANYSPRLESLTNFDLPHTLQGELHRPTKPPSDEKLLGAKGKKLNVDEVFERGAAQERRDGTPSEYKRLQPRMYRPELENVCEKKAEDGVAGAMSTKLSTGNQDAGSITGPNADRSSMYTSEPGGDGSEICMPKADRLCSTKELLAMGHGESRQVILEEVRSLDELRDQIHELFAKISCDTSQQLSTSRLCSLEQMVDRLGLLARESILRTATLAKCMTNNKR